MGDKGHLGAVPGAPLDPKMGLRDKIIARDAAQNQIAGVNGVQANGSGLQMPTVATKRDAGRFDAAPAALGAAPAASRPAPVAIAPPKPKEKKSMFTITGPLSDRQILKQVAPEYPAWAQAQGIEAAVVLEFTVDSAGNVKPNVVVRRTSGYQKLDDTAIDALRQWKFVPLDANRDEVGLITFNYSLH
jgi:TonB family protein